MPTLAHRSIRHCLQMIGPFSPTASLSEESQRQFYDCICHLYQAMLENPEAYFVFPGPYEAYMEKPKLAKAGPEKAHTADSRESSLRNTIQQSITFYALFFWEIGIRCVLNKEGSVCLSAGAWQDVLQKMDSLHGAEHNTGRYALLKSTGLFIEEQERVVTITHTAYPCMMPALFHLCQAPENKYKFMNYLRLDFKNAGASPTVSDICRTLPASSVRIIEKLEAAFSSLKVRAKIKPLRSITSDFRWKVEYTKGGKNIAGFYASEHDFLLLLYFNDHKNITALAGELMQENSPLFSWFCACFPERLCRCPSNRRVLLGSEYRRICGLSNRAEIQNPSEADLQNALTILKRFRNL